MYNIIRTVCGDLEHLNLGITYCHDHLFVFPVEGARQEKKVILDSFEKTRKEV